MQIVLVQKKRWYIDCYTLGTWYTRNRLLWVIIHNKIRMFWKWNEFHRITKTCYVVYVLFLNIIVLLYTYVCVCICISLYYVSVCIVVRLHKFNEGTLLLPNKLLYLPLTSSQNTVMFAYVFEIAFSHSKYKLSSSLVSPKEYCICSLFASFQ